MEKPTDFFSPPPPVDPIAAYTADAAVSAQDPPAAQTAPPASDAPTEATTEQTAAPAWETEKQTIEQRAAEAERRAQEAQERITAYERQEAQRAAQAWRDAEAQMKRDLPTMDPDDAIRVQEQFYEQQRQFLLQANQQTQGELHAMRLNGFADHIIREQGLTESDRTRLLWVGQRDPNEMVAEATRIKSERTASSSEINTLRQQIETLQRQVQANQVIQSGAFRTGGHTAPAAPAPKPKPGTPEHLLSLAPELASHLQRTG